MLTNFQRNLAKIARFINYSFFKFCNGGGDMSNRKVADCRLFPSEKNCSLTIAGTEEEVLTIAVRHAVEEHGHEDTPELRKEIHAMLQDE